jgi:hypothetical protein
LRIIAFAHLDGGGLDAPEGLSAYEGNDVQVFSAVSESKPEQLYTSNEHSDAIIAKLERHAGSFTPHLGVVRLPRQLPTVRGEPLPRNFPQRLFDEYKERRPHGSLPNLANGLG